MAGCTACLCCWEEGKKKKQCWEKSYFSNASQASAPKGCGPPLHGAGEGTWLVLSNLTAPWFLSRFFATEMAQNVVSLVYLSCTKIKHTKDASVT